MLCSISGRMSIAVWAAVALTDLPRQDPGLGKLTLTDKVEKLLPTKLEDLCSRGIVDSSVQLSSARHLWHLLQIPLLFFGLLLGILLVPVPYDTRPLKWPRTVREIDLQPPITSSLQKKFTQGMTACRQVFAQYMTILRSTKRHLGT